jgi:glutathione peroxidase
MNAHRGMAVLAGLLVVSAAAVFVTARPADRTEDVIKEPTAAPAKAEKDQPVSPLDFKLKSIDGKEFDLSQFKGKTVLLVNVASKCGLTPQYKALQALYEKYKDQGFVIVGFPANNFGGQEPGTEAQIKEFCSSKYNVTFPMTSKISVKGDDQHALYKFLTSKDTDGDFAGDIEWNFAKFLVDRNGNVMARFASKTKPDDAQVTEAVEKALAAKATATASAK